MKATWDPSALLWDEKRLVDRAYVDLAEAVLRHIELLESRPIRLLMPEGWEEIYQYFPYADTRFHPEAMELASIFWGFMGKHLSKIVEVAPLKEVVILQPDICPDRLLQDQKLSLRGFFGELGLRQDASDVTAILSAGPDRFVACGHKLAVVFVGRKHSTFLSVVFDHNGWEVIEEFLDYRPDVVLCLSMKVRHLCRSVEGALSRPFRLTPALKQYLVDISDDDQALFAEIIEAMAKWVTGITSGLKAHKPKRNKWRLDVRKGEGNKVHARFVEGLIEFFEYHDDHDRYKIK